MNNLPLQIVQKSHLKLTAPEQSPEISYIICYFRKVISGYGRFKNGFALLNPEIYNPNPETNNNGLLTIEVGAVIPVKGTFPEIDWSDGPCFLKTETAPSGWLL